jgi:hypothetical protein
MFVFQQNFIKGLGTFAQAFLFSDDPPHTPNSAHPFSPNSSPMPGSNRPFFLEYIDAPDWEQLF